jgi:hypothetical protein
MVERPTGLPDEELDPLLSSEPALRVLASGDVWTIAFASRRDRDAAFATFFAGAQPRRSRNSAA